MNDANEMGSAGSMEMHLSGHDGSVQKGEGNKAIVASYPKNDNDVELEAGGVLGSAKAAKSMKLDKPKCTKCIVKKCNRRDAKK